MFTQPAFIRKNTPELQKKLEELGYKPSRIIFDNEKLCIATAVNGEYAMYTNITEEMFDDTNPHRTWNCAGRIDCETNEEVFLSIAGMKDDTDKNQWFILDTMDCVIESMRVREFFVCDEDDIKDMMFYDSMFLNCHKATAEELINHFRSNEQK